MELEVSLLLFRIDIVRFLVKIALICINIYFFCKKNKRTAIVFWLKYIDINNKFLYLIQSEVIYLTVNRLTRIRVRCGQRIRN